MESQNGKTKITIQYRRVNGTHYTEKKRTEKKA